MTALPLSRRFASLLAAAALLLLPSLVSAQALEPSSPAPTLPAGSGAQLDAMPAAKFPPIDVDYSALDRLIVQHGGRKKPFLTFALEMSRELSGRASVRLNDGTRVEARAFIGSLFLGQPEWSKEPVILLDYAPLKRELGLPITQKHFTFDELLANPKVPILMQQVQAVKAREGTNARLSTLLKQVELLGQRLDVMNALLRGSLFTVIPHPTQENGAWVAVPDITSLYPAEKLSSFNKTIFNLVMAYHTGKTDGSFEEAATALIAEQKLLSPENVPSGARITTELRYDLLHPFRFAWVFYLLGAIAFAATWKYGRNAGAWFGWGFTALGLVFHLGAFAARIYISGRAPVTNMYETVVWVALCLLGFAIWYEAKYKSRIFIVSALPMAVLLMIVADSLPVVLSPSLNPLVAVLRDNFWLTTHVLTVTTSYAAFALAMAVGHIALFKQIVTPGPQSVHPDILAYIYRAMQIGILLLVFGIILGGVWANYSWGRFWGWDPKETWALIAALVYLAILHGRIAGWWSPFGFAVGAVLGFQGVIMAWYGVNFVIGAGLHSYGFGTGGQAWVGAFCVLEFVLVAAALIRRRITSSGAAAAKSPSQS